MDIQKQTFFTFLQLDVFLCLMLIFKFYSNLIYFSRFISFSCVLPVWRDCLHVIINNPVMSDSQLYPFNLLTVFWVPQYIEQPVKLCVKRGVDTFKSRHRKTRLSKERIQTCHVFGLKQYGLSMNPSIITLIISVSFKTNDSLFYSKLEIFC